MKFLVTRMDCCMSWKNCFIFSFYRRYRVDRYEEMISRLDANIPLLIIGDAIDVLPMSAIGRIFDYLENNLVKITTGLEPGKEKALPLLRLCIEALGLLILDLKFHLLKSR